ncbi:MAG: hypothetical protein QOJ65_1437 [Fimbriimonadaceae bacterium]|nr:hypothetical protein [Fimbriimonadaceae bacterium]
MRVARNRLHRIWERGLYEDLERRALGCNPVRFVVAWEGDATGSAASSPGKAMLHARVLALTPELIEHRRQLRVLVFEAFGVGDAWRAMRVLAAAHLLEHGRQLRVLVLEAFGVGDACRAMRVLAAAKLVEHRRELRVLVLEALGVGDAWRALLTLAEHRGELFEVRRRIPLGRLRRIERLGHGRLGRRFLADALGHAPHEVAEVRRLLLRGQGRRMIPRRIVLRWYPIVHGVVHRLNVSAEC